MDSAAEVVAVLGPGGSTVLHTLRAHGSLAVRQTGPAQVHLVGTAAGPLGGDRLELRLRVGPGAVLAVRSAAATIALPGADGGHGEILLCAQVEDGGLLDCALEPLVVCARAQVRAQTRVTLAGSGQLHLVDRVVLGRHGEDGGHWLGRTVVDRDGHPVLRQSTDSWLVAGPGSGVRALVSSLETASPVDGDPVDGDPVDGARQPVGAPATARWIAAPAGDAVACPLAGGALLVTATGPDLPRAWADHAAARRLCGSGPTGRRGDPG